MLSRANLGGFPLLSCFVNDCLARGKDIDRGGARANWIESSFVGLANLVDSLAAIRELVYRRRDQGDGAFSLSRVRAGMLTDFADDPDLGAAIRGVPKYGNDDDDTDALASTVTEFLLQECESRRSHWGDAVVPGFFCWIMHEHLGRQTRASCDGRTSGFPLADGSGPAQGRERNGPTAMVRSVTRWNHAPMIGGIAVNMRFQPQKDRSRLASTIRPVLEAFLRLGGFEAQVNVVGRDVLLDAQAHPERHRDLVVRIAGYSDYFVGLSSEMQAEVIARSELA
jgi:formate C-acetyltransferase